MDKTEKYTPPDGDVTKCPNFKNHAHRVNGDQFADSIAILCSTSETFCFQYLNAVKNAGTPCSPDRCTAVQECREKIEIFFATLGGLLGQAPSDHPQI